MIFSLKEGKDEKVIPSVILIILEAIAYSTWQAFLNRYYIRYSIDRTVLDKAYKILINSDF